MSQNFSFPMFPPYNYGPQPFPPPPNIHSLMLLNLILSFHLVCRYPTKGMASNLAQEFKQTFSLSSAYGQFQVAGINPLQVTENTVDGTKVCYCSMNLISNSTLPLTYWLTNNLMYSSQLIDRVLMDFGMEDDDVENLREMESLNPYWRYSLVDKTGAFSQNLKDPAYDLMLWNLRGIAPITPPPSGRMNGSIISFSHSSNIKFRKLDAKSLQYMDANLYRSLEKRLWEKYRKLVNVSYKAIMKDIHGHKLGQQIDFTPQDEDLIEKVDSVFNRRMLRIRNGFGDEMRRGQMEELY